MPNYLRYYVENSMVFITVVTYNRQPILLDNIKILRQSIKEARYGFQIVAGVILKDHFHILIKPENIRELPKIIFSIKYRFSRNIGGVGTPPYNMKRKGERKIWQSRYYDHVIRDENDLYRHLDYIHYNPIKHDYVKKVANYPYSSFEKFVKIGYYDKDWCNLEDKNKINELNYE